MAIAGHRVNGLRVTDDGSLAIVNDDGTSVSGGTGTALDPGSSVDVEADTPIEVLEDQSGLDDGPIRTRATLVNLSTTDDVWLYFGDDTDEADTEIGYRIPPGGDHVEYEYKGVVLATAAAPVTVAISVI